MAEFIVNPRRGPRAPARCRAAVVSPAGFFETETEDIGPMGCQIVAPKLLGRGELIQLTLSNERLRQPLLVNGRVAWVSPSAPWRIGVAFVEASRGESARWFERLVAAHPGLGWHSRVPRRIATSSTVYLGPPPRFVVDFSAEEGAILRAIGSGARVDELLARLGHRGAPMERALFSLIARQAITFQPDQAAHPGSWGAILSELDAGADATGGARAPAGAAPHPAPAGTLPPPPSPQAAPPAARAPGAGTSAEAPGGAGGARSPAEPGRPSAGSAWRGATVERSAEAQAALDRAIAEIRTGSTSGAIAHLRRALSLAPGDPEIAGLLGKLAFKDRVPPA